MKLEHIGIAVKSLEESDRLFSRLLGKTNYKHETVEREGVTTSFYAVGESKVELLESSTSEGVIGRYIEKRGEGVHHLAFLVEDLETEIERLEAEGFSFLSTTPKEGADGKLIVFLHPKTTGGVLVELSQEKRG